MQLPKNLNQKQLQPHILSQSRNKSQSYRNPTKLVPLLIRYQQTINYDDNVMQITNNKLKILDDFALPSNNFIKQKNIVIPAELNEKVSLSNKHMNSNNNRQKVRRRIKTQVNDLQNQITISQRLLTDPVYELSKTPFQQLLIDKEKSTQYGVRHPYKIFHFNDQRKKFISDLLKSQNKTDVLDNFSLSQIKQDLGQRLRNQVKSRQKEKTKKEITSKLSINNALHNLLTLNQHSQESVELKFRQYFTKDSKFQIQ